MGLFKSQLANVVEWEEYRDDVIFYKWNNSEIKKGSRLIIRPGQDAIFLYNGVTEGVFEKEGNYDIESDIIPFLSTLKGFKFGFNQWNSCGSHFHQYEGIYDEVGNETGCESADRGSARGNADSCERNIPV